MNITIGADEIILWLRKNNKTQNQRTIDLGNRILTLMEKIGAQIIQSERDKECFWDVRGDSKNINEFGLPKTSAQYEININNLIDLYSELNKW